jgi:hypothetical protein
MKKIKKDYLIATTTVIVGVVILVWYFSNRPSSDSGVGSPSPTPTITPRPVPEEVVGSWGKLRDIAQSLGEPEEEVVATETGIITKTIPTKGTARTHTTVYDQGVPILVKKAVTTAEKRTTTALETIYGKEEAILYGPLEGFGYNLYAYPSSGFAYVGNKVSGDVTEEWYFAKTSLDNFVLEYAENYSLKPGEIVAF